MCRCTQNGFTFASSLEVEVKTKLSRIWWQFFRHHVHVIHCRNLLCTSCLCTNAKWIATNIMKEETKNSELPSNRIWPLESLVYPSTMSLHLRSLSSGEQHACLNKHLLIVYPITSSVGNNLLWRNHNFKKHQIGYYSWIDNHWILLDVTLDIRSETDQQIGPGSRHPVTTRSLHTRYESATITNQKRSLNTKQLPRLSETLFKIGTRKKLLWRGVQSLPTQDHERTSPTMTQSWNRQNPPAANIHHQLPINPKSHNKMIHNRRVMLPIEVKRRHECSLVVKIGRY